VSAKSDLTLISEALAGSEEAYSPLTQRYWKKVCSFIRRRVSNYAVAEEVTQDTFMAAYRYLHTYRGDSNLYTWLCTIALNELTRQPFDSLKTDSDDVCRRTPEDELSTKEQFNRLIANISELPYKEQRALILRHIEGMAYDEIAAHIDCTPKYARVLVCQAKRTLRREHDTKRKLPDDGSLTKTPTAECV
jgi:RNA polymerase sigma-70 factor, ECF subfamily